MFIILSIIIFILLFLHLHKYYKKASEYSILEQYYANVLTSFRNPDFQIYPYILLDFPEDLSKLRNSSLFSKFSYSSEFVDLDKDNFFSHKNDTLWIIGNNDLQVDLYIHYLSNYFTKNSNKPISKIKSFNLIHEKAKNSNELEFITIKIPKNAILQIPRNWIFTANQNIKVFTTHSLTSFIGNLF